MAEATLYNKKRPILDVELEHRKIIAIGDVLDFDFLPLALQNRLDLDSINQWLRKRLIPQNREGLKEAQAIFGKKMIRDNNRNMFSLTDQYWFQFHETETWSKLNFFTNRYHSGLGDAFFTPWDVDVKHLKDASPDITTNGALRKTWIQDENLNSYLIKAGSTPYAQEPLSEVLASLVLNKINVIDFVRYDLYVHGLRICSKCRDFVTEDTEFVPAKHLYDRKKKPPRMAIYDHLAEMCKEYGMSKSDLYLDRMILVDMLIGNSDRHLGNFGFLRDVNTGKMLGFAPLFDFGSAFWEFSDRFDKKPKNRIFEDQEKRVLRQYNAISTLQRLNKTDDLFQVIDTYPDLTAMQKQAIKDGILNRLKLIRLPGTDRGALGR